MLTLKYPGKIRNSFEWTTKKRMKKNKMENFNFIVTIYLLIRLKCKNFFPPLELSSCQR